MNDHPVEIPELPDQHAIDRLVALLEPLSRFTQPKLYGAEHLPADGSLLVGNHTIYGFRSPRTRPATPHRRGRSLARA
jgi:hypothetical protein